MKKHVVIGISLTILVMGLMLDAQAEEYSDLCQGQSGAALKICQNVQAARREMLCATDNCPTDGTFEEACLSGNCVACPEKRECSGSNPPACCSGERNLDYAAHKFVQGGIGKTLLQNKRAREIESRDYLKSYVGNPANACNSSMGGNYSRIARKEAYLEFMKGYLLAGSSALVKDIYQPIPMPAEDENTYKNLQGAYNRFSQATSALYDESYSFLIDNFLHYGCSDISYFGNNGQDYENVLDGRKIIVRAVEKKIDTVLEMAANRNILGKISDATALLEGNAQFLYYETMKLASSYSNPEDFYAIDGDVLFASFFLLRDALKNLRDGVNPLGFQGGYYPILWDENSPNDRTYNIIGKNDGIAQRFIQTLRDAEEDLKWINEEYRDYEESREKLKNGLIAMEETINNRLLDLCGNATDENGEPDLNQCGCVKMSDGSLNCDTSTLCDPENANIPDNGGGKIFQAICDAEKADQEIELAEMKYNAIPKEIEIILAEANAISAALEYKGKQMKIMALAFAEQQQCTTIKTEASRETIRVEGSLKCLLGPFLCIGGIEGAYRNTHRSMSKEICRPVPAIVQFAANEKYLNAITEATIVDAKATAEAQRKLIHQAELGEMIHIAKTKRNQLIAQVNDLINTATRLAAAKERGEREIESKLAFVDPTLRIIRDHVAEKTWEARALAHRWVYLYAKSVEYDLLKQFPFDQCNGSVPCFKNIFLALSSTDLDIQFDNILSYRTHATEPRRESQMVNISLRKNFGILSNTAILDANGDILNANQQFENLLRRNMDRYGNIRLNVHFSILPFSPDPSAEIPDYNLDYGVALSKCHWDARINTVRFNLVGTGLATVNFKNQPITVMTMKGPSQFRDGNGALLTYTFRDRSEETEKTLGTRLEFSTSSRAEINGDAQEGDKEKKGLFDLSPYSSWTITVAQDSNLGVNLADIIDKIEDIEIILDYDARTYPDCSN